MVFVLLILIPYCYADGETNLYIEEGNEYTLTEIDEKISIIEHHLKELNENLIYWEAKEKEVITKRSSHKIHGIKHHMEQLTLRLIEWQELRESG